MSHVPVRVIDHLTPAQLRAYVIADNRLAERAGWDRALLALEFKDLSALDLDFDLTITGFEFAEIDKLIVDLDASAATDDPLDDVPPPPLVPVTRIGDIWQIGPHRLICGDATKEATYQALLDEERAQMVFADCPYNVPVNGHVSGLGKNQQREFVQDRKSTRLNSSH